MTFCLYARLSTKARGHEPDFRIEDGGRGNDIVKRRVLEKIPGQLQASFPNLPHLKTKPHFEARQLVDC